jgi:hypothetical protein
MHHKILFIQKTRESERETCCLNIILEKKASDLIIFEATVNLKK